MSLFKYNTKNLQLIKESRFDLEKDIQALTEKNLEQIFGLKFIASEFALNNLRIDTLAFDEESNSFVIIEYKRDRNISIIDQGYAYLSLLINNKADFILHYNETQTQSFKKDDIDWSQTRVIFIAHSYTAHQRQAINFADMPIELWKVAKYEGNVIEFDRLETAETSESIKTFSKTSGVVQKVSKEIKKYTIDDHLKPDWKKSSELFKEIREKILNLDDRIEEKFNRSYIGYKIGSKVLISIKSQKNNIILELIRVKPEHLNDPKNKTKYLKNSYKYFHKYITQYKIYNSEDIQYGVGLAEQVYNKFFK